MYVRMYVSMKINITISIDQKVLEVFDEMRGILSRGEFLGKLLEGKTETTPIKKEEVAKIPKEKISQGVPQEKSFKSFFKAK